MRPISHFQTYRTFQKLEFSLALNATVDLSHESTPEIITSTNAENNYLYIAISAITKNLKCTFYPRDAILARVIEIATCPSVCLSVRPSRAGIVSKRRKLAA